MTRYVSIAPYHYNVVTVGVEFSVNTPYTDVYTHKNTAEACSRHA